MAISFDRYFSVIVKNWKTSILTPLRANVLGFIIAAILIGSNIHVLVMFGHVFDDGNGTTFVQCYETDDPSTKVMGITQLVKYMFYV